MMYRVYGGPNYPDQDLITADTDEQAAKIWLARTVAHTSLTPESRRVLLDHPVRVAIVNVELISDMPGRQLLVGFTADNHD